MGPTADAWLQCTSLFSIWRFGTDSAQASSESLMLRFVWKALVPRASLATRMRPVYTDRERSLTTPLKSRLLVVSGRGVLLEGAVVEGLVAVAEVGGDELPGRAAAQRAGSRCGAGRSRRRSRPAPAVTLASWWAATSRLPTDQPARIESLQAGVAGLGAPLRRRPWCPGARSPRPAAVELLDDGGRAALAERDHQVGGGGRRRRPGPRGGRRSARRP